MPWLDWVRRLQHVAETGLTYATDPYDVARYEQVLAVAGELAAAGTGEDPRALAGRLAADELGHPTPKVDVRGAVVRDGRVLLVRERCDGRWTLPGGWADIGEPPSAATAREVREESGVAVRVTRLVAVHDRDRRNAPPHPHHIYKLIFLCEPLDAPPGQPDHEVSAVERFALDDLPPLSTGRTSRYQLERVFAHHADPSLPTEFD
jgi:ADP-ribose pyrophosphatase YjhB (NUDIX family)